MAAYFKSIDSNHLLTIGTEVRHGAHCALRRRTVATAR